MAHKNPPIVDQDGWQQENLYYLVKDGHLADQVLPLLHAGDYELEENEDDDNFAIVTVKLRLVILNSE